MTCVCALLAQGGYVVLCVLVCAHSESVLAVAVANVTRVLVPSSSFRGILQGSFTNFTRMKHPNIHLNSISKCFRVPQLEEHTFTEESKDVFTTVVYKHIAS